MKKNKLKITIVGLGYVGTSMSFLLSRQHNVTALDIDKEKVQKINKGISPILDLGISKFLQKKPKLNLLATTSKTKAFKGADLIIICTPTDYDELNNSFNVQTIHSVMESALALNRSATYIIKSTVPIGFTKSLVKKYSHQHIYFSPEFLREGQALEDNLRPSRIIVGNKSEESKLFAGVLQDASITKNVPVIMMTSTEAESVKLFANSYLAMRVAFFNELDNFAIHNNLNTASLIKGISYDSRIGNFYNNPSFGYGGYCLPKDTKQLNANFNKIPNSLISSIIKSNELRKKFLTKKILERNPSVIGIYRLSMKSGSDNYRNAAILDLIKLLKEKVKILIYEPQITTKTFQKIPIENSFTKFSEISDLIISNRIDDKLLPFSPKVFTRDIFGNN